MAWDGRRRNIAFIMARELRIEYPGAACHVMARGNQGRAIWRDDRDRLRFLETPGEACGKTAWHLHAYVLMWGRKTSAN